MDVNLAVMYSEEHRPRVFKERVLRKFFVWKMKDLTRS